MYSGESFKSYLGGCYEPQRLRRFVTQKYDRRQLRYLFPCYVTVVPDHCRFGMNNTHIACVSAKKLRHGNRVASPDLVLQPNCAFGAVFRVDSSSIVPLYVVLEL